MIVALCIASAIAPLALIAGAVRLVRVDGYRRRPTRAGYDSRHPAG